MPPPSTKQHVLKEPKAISLHFCLLSEKSCVDFTRMDQRIAKEAQKVLTSWLPEPGAEGGCFLTAGSTSKESIRNGERTAKLNSSEGIR